MAEPAPAPEPTPPAQIPVVDPTGQLVVVPEADAPQAFAAGARPAEAEEIREAARQQRQEELQAQYGGTGLAGAARAAAGSIGADVAGFERGLGQAMGVPTDKLVIDASRAIGGEQGAQNARARLGELQELHPLQSKRSELAGALLPSLVAPEAGVAGAGEAVGEGGAALLGRGATSFLGRTAIRGARGAVEGGLYMGTDAVNEAALGDHELRGEQLFAAMGKGALFGAALSTGGGALGDAAGSAWRGGGRLLTRSLAGEGESSVTGALMKQRGEIAFRAAGGTKAMAQEAERFAGGADAVGNRWADEAPGLVGKKSWGDLTREDLPLAAERGQEKYARLLDEHLARLDSVAAARGVQPKASQVIDQFNREVIGPVRGTIGAEAVVRKLEAFRDSMAKHWGVALDEAGTPLVMGDTAVMRAPTLEPEEGTLVDRNLGAEMRDRVRDLKKATAEASKATQEADAAFAKRAAAEDFGENTAVAPKAPVHDEGTIVDGTVVDRSLARRMAEERAGVKSPAAPQFDAEKTIVQKRPTVIDDAKLSDPVLSFKQLRDARIAADRVWKGNSIDPNLMGYKGEFLRARHVLEDRLLAAGDQLAPELGSKFVEGYQAAKQGYQAFTLLEKNAAKGVAGDAKNRILSLTDNIVGGAGAKVGGLIGSAFGPVGTAAGAAVGGAGAAIANHVIRKRFNFVAPDVLEKAAALFRAEKTAAIVDREMTDGIKGFFSHPYRGRAAAPASVTLTRPERGETKVEAHARVAAEISRLANDPRAQATQFAKEAGDLPVHAPKTAAALAMTQARATQFLASKLPPGHIDRRSLTPHLEKPRISDAERTQFARYLATIDDPTSVLDDMKTGRLTREQVEALRAVYPKMYAELQQKVAGELVDLKEPLPYAKRVQLATLLDVPTDATMDPKFVKAVQGTYGPTPAADEEGGAAPLPGSGKAPDVATNMFTASQEIEKGL